MIESTYFWLIVFFISLGTLSIRFSFIALSSKMKINKDLEKIFSFIPAAILPALFTPMVFFHKGTVDQVLGMERMVILIFAIIVSYKTKSMVATILFGLLSLYAITQI